MFSSPHFTKDDIFRIINTLDTNGYDKISICMLKSLEWLILSEPL